MQWGLLAPLALGLAVVLLPGCEKESDGSNSIGDTLAKGKTDKPSGAGSTGGSGTGGGCGSTPTEKPPQTAAALKIDWVKVKATEEFLMGSPDTDPYADDDEKPQHKVKLSGFWMSATEVTNAQYKQFLASLPDDSPHKKSGSNYPGLDKLKGDDKPVVYVSYDDALAFCEWVGHGVTLPTEAQWEYACRAGSTTKYSFGDALEQDQANIDGSTWQEDGVDVTMQTRAVGQYQKNAFGLYDMHGNVVEWCLDWFGEEYYQKCKGAGTEDKVVENPKGPTSGSDRMIRGGSWYDEAAYCRSAFRYYDSPGHRDNGLGFRIVAPVAP